VDVDRHAQVATRALGEPDGATLRKTMAKALPWFASKFSRVVAEATREWHRGESAPTPPAVHAG